MSPEEENLISKWPESFGICVFCEKVHETFIDCKTMENKSEVKEDPDKARKEFVKQTPEFRRWARKQISGGKKETLQEMMARIQHEAGPKPIVVD